VKTPLHPKMLCFGTPVVLLSSLNADGTTNCGTTTHPSSLARGWQMPELQPRVPAQGLRATAQ
jgi:hypothetical protein